MKITRRIDKSGGRIDKVVFRIWFGSNTGEYIDDLFGYIVMYRNAGGGYDEPVLITESFSTTDPDLALVFGKYCTQVAYILKELKHTKNPNKAKTVYGFVVTTEGANVDNIN